MILEILCVGTELLLGEIVNTDGAFIAREAAALGFSSYHQTTVGDNPERLLEALRLALSRADIVVTTGGLGPTCDDITKNAAAEVFGKKLVFHDEVREDLEKFFSRVGRPMTENNLSQCLAPEGAEIFYNKWGTAPGLAVTGEIDGRSKRIILLPGPPSECEPMFEECVKPYLRALSPEVIRSLNLHLYGIGESSAEAILRPLMEESVNPTVAPYAGEFEVRIRVTAKAADEEEALSMCRAMADRVRSTEAGAYVYAETGDPFSAKNAAAVTLLSEFGKRGLTFATAESLTAGMIGSLTADIPGSSSVYLGGIISYSNSVKRDVLGVPAAVLDSVGPVSEECAAAMAQGARRLTGADVAVSVTGIAGPGGAEPGKPVGTVWFGVATKNGTHTETRLFGGKKDRAKIRRLTAAHAMMLAIRAAKEL